MDKRGSRGHNNRGGGGFGRSKRADFDPNQHSTYVLIE
jgi:hypothetical protein